LISREVVGKPGKIAGAASAGRQKLAGPLQVRRSIDTERDRVNASDVDAQARLQGAQLLQPLDLTSDEWVLVTR